MRRNFLCIVEDLFTENTAERQAAARSRLPPYNARDIDLVS